jgi:predicted Ser/Thr protein kinase
MADDPRIGTELAGFRIEAVIGRGGMGTVYLAEQLRYGRKVALKVLAPELSVDESFRERFEREWQAATRVEHPNIVPIYEAGEAEGVLYIAMRYVEGVDLNALLEREGRLDPDLTLAITGQVGVALDAAHQHGLVHRDVKPANILIASDVGLEGQHVYLTDFGVAKQTQTRSGLTRAGFFVGTVDYAAPEQIEGKALDGRADVYALGCVLYQCLTGSLPYEKDSEVAMLYAHVSEPPPSLAEKRPDLPAELGAVITKALAKSPDHRYSTCRELIAAARAATAGWKPRAGATPTVVEATRTVIDAPVPPVAGAPPPPGGPVRPWWRSKVALAAAAAAVVALAVGLGIGLSGGGGGGGSTQAATGATTATDAGTTAETQAGGLTETTATTAETETTAATDTGGVTETADTTTAAGDGFPNETESLLLSHVPERIRSTCEREVAEDRPKRAIAGVFCRTNGPVRAFYDLFDSRRRMYDYYYRWARTSGAVRNQGTCGGDASAEGTYDSGGRLAGRVVCWFDSNGRATVVWANERLNVAGYAFRPDDGAKALYRWWTNAGPIE